MKNTIYRAFVKKTLSQKSLVFAEIVLKNKACYKML